MSYEKLGFVSGQKLKAEHLNHMEEGIANAGGVTSWNDLTDKPFGSEVTEGVITFNGDTTGKTVFDGFGAPYVKMSDKLLTVDEIVGSTIDTVIKVGDEDISGQYVIEESWVQVFEQSGAQIIQVDVIDVSSVFVLSGNTESLGVTTGEGVYFLALNEDDEIVFTRSISCLTGEVETIKTLDEKYLPDSVKGGGSFLLRISAEEIVRDSNGIYMCTTQFDELAKSLEAGYAVSITLGRDWDKGCDPSRVIPVSWVYTDGMLGVIVQTLNFEHPTTIIFTNGTYAPQL